LPATVNYLERFPVDSENEYPVELDYSGIENLRLRFKASLHRCFLNPAKKIYLRNFFKKNNINVVLVEYGVTGSAALEFVRSWRFLSSSIFTGSMLTRVPYSTDINRNTKRCLSTAAIPFRVRSEVGFF
jgi:hypothetical protein